MSREKVALFVPNLQAGGVERMRVHLANGFDRAGYDVDLVLAQSKGRFLQDVNEGVNIIDLDTTFVTGMGIGSVCPDLIAYLRRIHPDIFISSMNHVNIVSIVSHKLSSVQIKLIVSEHNPPAEDSGLKQKMVNTLATATYRWPDEIVAVSDGVADEVAKTYSLPRDDISVINNPVVTDEIFNKMEEPVHHSWIENPQYQVILGVGRFHRQKDFQTLIRSFEIVNKKVENTRLLMLGDGTQRENLEGLVRELELEEVVDFLGYVDNPYKYMSKSSVFVLSSRWEGFGNVLVEALACGCPVVSTDCPTGPREILCDGDYGPLVPVGDEEKLALAMIGVLNNPPDSAYLQQRASDFRLENIVDEYADLF